MLLMLGCWWWSMEAFQVHAVGAEDQVREGLQADGFGGDGGLLEAGHGVREPRQCDLQDHASAPGSGTLPADLLPCQCGVAVGALPCQGVPYVPPVPQVLLHGQADVPHCAHMLIIQ